MPFAGRASLLGLVTLALACDGGGGAKAPSTSDKTKALELVSECKAQVKEGEPVPRLKVPSVNGVGNVAVGPGKVTLVDFWATWCAPCRESFPKYQDLYVKYKASGLELVAISLDEETDDIPKFVASTGVKFPVGWDGGKKIPPCFDIKNMPTAYVVDRKGVVRFVHRGFNAASERAIEKEIKDLL